MSRDDVFVLIPHQTLDKVVGDPTYSQMAKSNECQLNCNQDAYLLGPWKKLSRAFARPRRFLGKERGPVQPSPLVEPPEYPAIPQKSATAAREQLRAANEVATINWERYQHTQHIVVNIGAAAFEPFVIGELDDPDEGLNAVDIRALYKYLMDRFAKISQTKID